LQRLIQDGLRLDKEVGVQEKSHFWWLDHWQNTCGAVYKEVNHRQLDPCMRTTEWVEWVPGWSTWLSYVKEQKK
jgi:hypothetical protein